MSRPARPRTAARPTAALVAGLALAASLASAAVRGAPEPPTGAESAGSAAPASDPIGASTSASGTQAGAETPELAVRARAEPQRVVAGQQVVLSLQVRAGAPLPPGHLRAPAPPETDVLLLGEDRRRASAGGSAEFVFERRYALFPRTPGPLAIAPLRFEAWRGGSLTPEVVALEPRGVEVLPRPAAPDGAPEPAAWLPARAVSLTEAGAATVRLAPGQAVERMLTLRAEGLPAQALPPIPLSIPFPLRVRADAPRLWNEHRPDGVVGYRLERVLISAAEPGEFVLPGPALRWWNTASSQWQRAATPDWRLIVAPFDSSSRRQAPSWDRGGEKAAAADAPAGADRSGEDGRGRWRAVWPWLLGAAVLAVAAALLLRGRRRRVRPARAAR